jgi:monoamine oxidase
MRSIPAALIVALTAILCLHHISGSIQCDNISTNTKEVDVVIVGAGMAGVAAYHELKKQQPNLNVLMLEATHRIGGRMKPATIGRYTIEHGPNWLQNKGTTVW